MEDCPVCLETFNLNSFNTLPCNHKICQKCYPQIRLPICPLCRQPYGDTVYLNQDENIEQPQLYIEIEYDFIDFLSPRQRRRQRNRRQLQNRPRPRRLTPLEPISVIQIDNLVIEDNNIPPISPTSPINRRYRKKIPNHKRIKQNHKRRNNTSNTYNFLRNQQNFF